MLKQLVRGCLSRPCYCGEYIEAQQAENNVLYPLEEIHIFEKLACFCRGRNPIELLAFHTYICGMDQDVTHLNREKETHNSIITLKFKGANYPSAYSGQKTQSTMLFFNID